MQQLAKISTTLKTLSTRQILVLHAADLNFIDSWQQESQLCSLPIVTQSQQASEGALVK